ncbi:uncharacterized protein LOC112015515 [Quercus suber]|uniref:uncharacterized protein LOC112015515 n=1 Tax=Quercus suber TaxID=58331 RepID=UPI0032DE7E10
MSEGPTVQSSTPTNPKITTETISRAPTKNPTSFFTISNGHSWVFSFATSATTKRVICSVLQVSLAYARRCQSCYWRGKDAYQSPLSNPTKVRSLCTGFEKEKVEYKRRLQGW